jgi:DNA-binding XRE family transcriptional regulator
VQKFREAALMAKAELARKAGISESTIDRVEAGHDCRMETKRKILFALGLTVQDGVKLFPRLKNGRRPR